MRLSNIPNTTDLTNRSFPVSDDVAKCIMIARGIPTLGAFANAALQRVGHDGK